MDFEQYLMGSVRVVTFSNQVYTGLLDEIYEKNGTTSLKIMRSGNRADVPCSRVDSISDYNAKRDAE